MRASTMPHCTTPPRTRCGLYSAAWRVQAHCHKLTVGLLQEDHHILAGNVPVALYMASLMIKTDCYKG